MSEKKRKAVGVELIPEFNEKEQRRGVYKVLDKIVGDHHPHLSEVSISLMWKFGWKADEDGRQKVAEAKRSNDTDRALRNCGRDVVVYLNHEVFNNGRFTENAIRFWIDHALTGIAPKYDKDGEELVNENGDPVFRTRKPDVVVFSEVVGRHDILLEELVTLRGVFDEGRERHDSLLDWAAAQNADAEDSGVEEYDNEPETAGV
jgi:hypothetical protein